MTMSVEEVTSKFKEDLKQFAGLPNTADVRRQISTLLEKYDATLLELGVVRPNSLLIKYGIKVEVSTTSETNK